MDPFYLHGVVGADLDEVFDELRRVLEVNVCCRKGAIKKQIKLSE